MTCRKGDGNLSARVPDPLVRAVRFNTGRQALRRGRAREFVSQSSLYALFQAAQVALENAGITRPSWSHPGLQAAFSTELIHRRKAYPGVFRDYLSSGLALRQVADYGRDGVSLKVAKRLVRRATAFVAAIEEATSHGTTPSIQ